MLATQVIRELKKRSDKNRALSSKWFFKTAPGEYGHGDVFMGVAVPDQRKIAKEFIELPLSEVKKLLESEVHEHRLTALLILVGQFQKGSAKTREKIARFYVSHIKYVNNWDLVDSSAHKILGEHLQDKDRSILYSLVTSKNLWSRRIAMIATLAFIAKNDFTDTLKISKILLSDTHDLMHKAVGWMLREVGKRDERVLKSFLSEYGAVMPRTMLRYAIEKFPEHERKNYLLMRRGV